MVTFKNLPTTGNRGESLCEVIRGTINIYGPEGRKIARQELKKRGMTNRDIEIIYQPKKIYGKGMTFRGLTCTLRFVPQVNKSFYSGIDHRWQAVNGQGYVYLEGSGTEGGMIIRSWN